KAPGYTECANSHARAGKLERDRVRVRPTTQSRGQGLHDYRCMHCRKLTSVPYIIPMIVAAPVIISGGGSRGGFGGGGSFGGGFGGGHTGGGGASGGW
ncbi:MAG: TPM domain-containing protein, partial [Muribaculaceae bacterium]|nr:TPM domain-containing protein [Muribaculaceae bacterium]